MPFLHDIREWLEAPVQDSIHIGDGDAIIGHGHTLGQGYLVTMDHFLFVEHAGTAVHYQLIGT